MNGKISKYGQLFIDRKKSFKAQTCCRSNSDRFDTANISVESINELTTSLRIV